MYIQTKYVRIDTEIKGICKHNICVTAVEWYYRFLKFPILNNVV